MRPLRILYVAYPLLPVSEHSAGGAEQMLWTLEREMAKRGHNTTVAACAGSEVAGELFATGEASERLDAFDQREQAHAKRIIEWLLSGAAAQFNLIHDHSGWFWKHAKTASLPVLTTLHLARTLYPPETFDSVPGNVTFNCVSRFHAGVFHDLEPPPTFVNNGIALDRVQPTATWPSARSYVLWLGRICEEKGTHTALDVAHAAGQRIVIAGAIYPFLYHQKYYAREVIPRLKRAGSLAKFVHAPSFLEKLDLIRGARAVLVTSQIDESSSIVAMEAAACGTPALAFDRGALPEVVTSEFGRICTSPDDMAATLRHLPKFEASRIRAYADGHFSAQAMADGYEHLYSALVTKPSSWEARAP